MHLSAMDVETGVTENSSSYFQSDGLYIVQFALMRRAVQIPRIGYYALGGGVVGKKDA